MIHYLKQILDRCRKQREFKEKQERIYYKDILRFDEAVFYLNTTPEVLLTEVLRGNLPAGQLGEEWYFIKDLLIDRFRGYCNYRVLPYRQNNEVVEENLPKYDLKINDCSPDIENKVKNVLKKYKAKDVFFDSEDLSYGDFNGLHLEGIEFYLATLIETNFKNCDLSFANFVGANCHSANFTSAKLVRSKFARTDLVCPDGNYYRTNLTNANLAGANLCGSIISGAVCCGANFSRADLSEVDFTGADLTDANLIGAILVETDLSRATLDRCDFSGAKIIDVKF